MKLILQIIRKHFLLFSNTFAINLRKYKNNVKFGDIFPENALMSQTLI
jgi:hypothetical protein